MAKAGGTLGRDLGNLGVGKQAEAPEHIPTRVAIIPGGDCVTTVPRPFPGTLSGGRAPRQGEWVVGHRSAGPEYVSSARQFRNGRCAMPRPKPIGNGRIGRCIQHVRTAGGCARSGDDQGRMCLLNGPVLHGAGAGRYPQARKQQGDQGQAHDKTGPGLRGLAR